MSLPLPPRIKALPVIGAVPQLLRNFRQLLQDDAPSYGDVVRIPVGKTDLYIISHPDYLQHILRDNHKSYSRGGLGSGVLKRVIGRGLIVLEGQEWLTARRMMQPYFHRKYFPALIDTMVQAVDETLDSLDVVANGEVVELVPFIKRLTITVFLKAMYSMSLDTQTIERIGPAFDKAMRQSALRDRYNYFIPAGFRLPIDRRIDENVGYLDEITESIIAGRRKLSEQPADLMGLMIEAADAEDGSRMSDEQLRDEAKTLIAGGYDTTSGTLLWLIQLLRDQPEITAKIVEEANRAFSSPITYERVSELEYSRRVVMEALRLRPVSWANNRYCIADDELGGYRIPANSNILFPIMHIQSDPRWWDEPNVFNPDRWADKNGGARHSWAFVPFGGGPRVCLGEHFALLEATLVTSKLLQRFDIMPVHSEPLKVAYEFTMQPETMPVRITRREAVPAC